MAREAEEAIAAVRRRVFGDDIVVALLEGEDAGGILATVVDAFHVAAHAEVERAFRVILFRLLRQIASPQPERNEQSLS